MVGFRRGCAEGLWPILTLPHASPCDLQLCWLGGPGVRGWGQGPAQLRTCDVQGHSVGQGRAGMWLSVQGLSLRSDSFSGVYSISQDESNGKTAGEENMQPWQGQQWPVIIQPAGPWECRLLWRHGQIFPGSEGKCRPNCKTEWEAEGATEMYTWRRHSRHSANDRSQVKAEDSNKKDCSSTSFRFEQAHT